MAASYAKWMSNIHQGKTVSDDIFAMHNLLAIEYVAYENEGRPDRNWVDLTGSYLGITSAWEIHGIGSFPG